MCRRWNLCCESCNQGSHEGQLGTLLKTLKQKLKQELSKTDSEENAHASLNMIERNIEHFTQILFDKIPENPLLNKKSA